MKKTDLISSIKQQSYTTGALLHRKAVKVITFVLTGTFVLGIVILPMSPKAYAWSGNPAACNTANYNINDWDWANQMKTTGGHPLDSPTPTPYPDFSLSNTSYLIFKTTTQDALTTSSNLQMSIYYLKDSTKRIQITEDSSGARTINAPDSGTPIYRSYFQMDKTHPATDITYNTLHQQTTVTTNTNVSCVAFANNINYTSAYTGTKWQSQATSISSPACDTTDIACYLRKAFDGVTNTFQAVGLAIVNGISTLFVPNMDNISAKYNDFVTFMHNKLGVLLFPIDFFTTIQTAFNSPSSFSCTTTSCPFNSGSSHFFGHSVSFDFSGLNSISSSLWTFVLLLIRLGLIIELILMLRKKYMGVVQK